MSSGHPAIFLDRDGVLNELVAERSTGHGESPLRVADARLRTDVIAALRRARNAGWLLVGVTNQPAAAKGTISKDKVEKIQLRVVALLGEAGVALDGWQVCLHHPEGVVPGLAGPCDCRKPAPGMLLTAARELHLDLEGSWMIGDTDVDVAAGRAAGTHTVLVENPLSAHKRTGSAGADLVAVSLAEAVASLLSVRRV